MGKRLSDEQIIEALLDHGTAKAAAAALGVNQMTISKRQRSEAFQESFQRAKTELLKRAATRLSRDAEDAVGIISEIMRDRENAPQVRLNAANYMLTHLLKVTETADFAERLEKLEQDVKEQQRYENSR